MISTNSISMESPSPILYNRRVNTDTTSLDKELFRDTTIKAAPDDQLIDSLRVMQISESCPSSISSLPTDLAISAEGSVDLLDTERGEGGNAASLPQPSSP